MDNRLTSFARKLRTNQTDVEKILWFQLRNRQIGGIKFRRQQKIGPYIVDFISYEKRVIIELDGGQHNEKQTHQQDIARTQWLEKEGFTILRFWNNEVINNLQEVLESIQRALTF
jgi:very-short-patch-repair endonuclease